MLRAALTKIRRFPPGVKASIAFFFSSIVTKGIAYITTPIYTRMLSSEEYGQVSVYLTWLQIFGIIAMFCLSYGVFNNGMIDYPDKRDDYSFSMLIFSNVITLCFTAALFCLYPLVGNYLRIGWQLMLLMCVVFFFQPAYNFWVARQRYEYKYKAVLFFSILCAIVSPLTALFLMWIAPFGERLYPRIFGAELSLIAIYILFYVYLGHKNCWKVNTKYWKMAFLFNLPLIPHYLSTYLLGSSDKIMISYLIGDSATAFYSVAYSVAAIATIIWSAMNSSLVPYTYEKCKVGDYGAINKVTLPLLSLFAVGCFLVTMMAPEVIWIMATDDYMEAMYVIPPVVGGVFFQVQYHIYANVVYYFKKPRWVMAGSLFAVAVNILLNFFCIKQWGYIAAGYTTLICYIIQAAIDYFAAKKVVGKSVYNIRIILALSLLVVAASLTCGLLYNHPFIRYSLVLTILALIFLFKNRIARIFSFKKKNNE